MFHSRILTRCLIGVAIALLNQSAVAQPQRGGLPAPAKTDVPAAGAETDMLRYVDLPMVEALINGQGPYRLVVDTGASGLVLKKELADQLELPAPPGMPEGMSIPVRAPGNDSGLTATLVHVENLSVGAATISGIWTVAMELPFGEDMDGAVGMNVFAECLLTYDYPGKKIRLSHGELAAPNETDIFSYTNKDGSNSHPQIAMEINGQSEQFLIDTGMRGWFSLSTESLKGLDVVQGPADGLMGTSAAGLFPEQTARLQNPISLGKNSVAWPTVRISTGSLSSRVVGSLFLEHFAVTFDAANNRVKFDGTETRLESPPLRSAGFGLEQEGDQMRVVWVDPLSSAAESELAAGHLVLEINDQPAADFYGTPEWSRVIRDNATLALRFRTADDPAVKQATIDVREILPAISAK